jgi:hypothetical protein
VDGIIGGEGNGPLAPKGKPCGVCIGGTDPIAVDTVSAVLMGFDPSKLKILQQAYHTRGYQIAFVSPDSIHCVSNQPAWNGAIWDLTDTLDFEPHFGWKGYVEASRRQCQPRAKQ